MIHPDDLPGCVERWVRSLTQGVDDEIEFRLRRHAGRYRWQLGRASPERDAQGQIVGWFGTNTDIRDPLLPPDAAFSRARARLRAGPEFRDGP